MSIHLYVSSLFLTVSQIIKYYVIYGNDDIRSRLQCPQEPTRSTWSEEVVDWSDVSGIAN